MQNRWCTGVKTLELEDRNLCGKDAKRVRKDCGAGETCIDVRKQIYSCVCTRCVEVNNLCVPEINSR